MGDPRCGPATAALPEFFALFTRAFLRHDQSYTTAGDIVAAALWAPPGAVPVSGEDAEELGQRIEELAGPDAPRFLGVNKLFDNHHPHGSYWYLQFMGVAPDRQGQGIGSALMAPVLERCDREGVRAYLDATSERNKRLYERHGFEAEDPFAPPGGHPCGRCGGSRPRIGSDVWSDAETSRCAGDQQQFDQRFDAGMRTAASAQRQNWAWRAKPCRTGRQLP